MYVVVVIIVSEGTDDRDRRDDLTLSTRIASQGFTAGGAKAHFNGGYVSTVQQQQQKTHQENDRRKTEEKERKRDEIRNAQY